MTSATLIPPHLSYLLQQITSILPLSALIEFIDIPAKLHAFELSGLVSLWNWPITPAGARLLLSNEGLSSQCFLDEIGRTSILHCIDGRYGDWYPSSAPATLSLSVSSHPVDKEVPNALEISKDLRARRQTLDVISVSQLDVEFQSRVSRILGTHSAKYMLVAGVGWLCWAGGSIICLMAQLYIAAAYLFLMPLTGTLVQALRGGKARQLLDCRPSDCRRLVVATKNLNGSDWLVFYGSNTVVNSLVNKPLYRTRSTPFPTAIKLLLQLLIAAQWVLVVWACGLQDWNSFAITFWIMLCVFVSSYAYTPHNNVQDWLYFNCHLSLRRIRAEFSSRRAMLGAIVYLNPDSSEGRTDWINPILSICTSRKEWECALLDFINSGK
jgi:hypothetical protein